MASRIKGGITFYFGYFPTTYIMPVHDYLFSVSVDVIYFSYLSVGFLVLQVNRRVVDNFTD